MRPILKMRMTVKSDSANYRPVVNSSNMLKLLEYFVLLSLNRNLNASSRQFGFRQSAKSQAAKFTVQEVIHSYTRENSNVQCALIDFTRAFDEINFDVLMSKIQKTQVPLLINKY